MRWSRSSHIRIRTRNGTGRVIYDYSRIIEGYLLVNKVKRTIYVPSSSSKGGGSSGGLLGSNFCFLGMGETFGDDGISLLIVTKAHKQRGYLLILPVDT